MVRRVNTFLEVSLAKTIGKEVNGNYLYTKIRQIHLKQCGVIDQI